MLEKKNFLSPSIFEELRVPLENHRTIRAGTLFVDFNGKLYSLTTFTDKISKFKKGNMPDILGPDIKSHAGRHVLVGNQLDAQFLL